MSVWRHFSQHYGNITRPNALILIFQAYLIPYFYGTPKRPIYFRLLIFSTPLTAWLVYNAYINVFLKWYCFGNYVYKFLILFPF